MIRILKAFLFLLFSAFFALLALAVYAGSLAARKTPYRPLSFLTRSWGRTMVRLLNIRCTLITTSNANRPAPCFALCNHISYLDIIVVASAFPSLFVAKSDVARWPLLGLMAKAGGTIFVNRVSLRGGIHSAKDIVKALASGSSVTLFPEGTSTNGTTVLPFKPSIFTAVIEAQAPIQPVTIRYTAVDGDPVSELNRDAVSWHGSMEFFPHFWNVLNLRSIDVRLIVHDRIPFSSGSTPRGLAEQTGEIVRSGLGR